MAMMTTQQPEQDEIAALLPWHAAGTLSRRDAERVEAALASDEGLARQYEIVREELAETIHLNESLGAPSARAMENLFAKIEAEGAQSARRLSFNLGGWLAAQISELRPRTLAWSATAAALLIVLQAGLLTGLYLNQRQSGLYETASVSHKAGVGQAAYALVSFVPQASADDVTKFLEAHRLSVVKGPQAGLYTVRVAQTPVSKEELAGILAHLREDSAIVRSVLPSSAPAD